jgi:hypothetical protein
MKKFSLIAVIAVCVGLVAWTSAGDITVTGVLKSLGVMRYSGATGVNFLKVPDNLATALTVEDYENVGDLLTLTTTNSAEKLTVSTRYLGLAAVSGSVTADVGSAAGSGAMTNTAVQVSTAASAGDAVTLPAAATGLVSMVCNGAAANAIDVFPAASDSINKETANVAIALAAGECMLCVAFDAIRWGCVVGSAT